MPMKILISGGGTGGHIFPALSIANAVKRRYPDAQILFVGALGRMEMERVPAAGYEIIGLPVAGFDRRRLWRNFAVVLKMLRSMRLARKILRNFQPRRGSGCRRLCLRPHSQSRPEKGNTHPAAGTELLCGGDQQAPGKESRRHMRGLQRHGAFLPRRQNSDDRQPRAPRNRHRPGGPRHSAPAPPPSAKSSSPACRRCSSPHPTWPRTISATTPWPWPTAAPP